MDRVQIKKRSKELLSKNYWLCVGVSFLTSLLGGGSSGPSINFNSSSSSSSIEDLIPENLIPEEIPETETTEIANLSMKTLSSTDASSFDISSILPDTGTEIIAYLGIIIAAVLAISAIALAISFAFYGFLGAQMRVGSCRFFLKNRKNQQTGISEMFASYKDNTFLNVAKVLVVNKIYITLWSLLFIVPGIIKGYEYAAVDYILAVNPNMKGKDAREMSARIMNGHKLELFTFEMSFLGWWLLSACTLGILGVFYVAPYYRIAEAEFFAELRNDAITKGLISYNDIPDYEEYIPQTPEYQQVNLYGNANFQQPIQNPIQPNSTVQTPNNSYDTTTFSPDVNS
jgi:uncharacterized membrane protein